jgi:hypothetical protein
LSKDFQNTLDEGVDTATRPKSYGLKVGDRSIECRKTTPFGDSLLAESARDHHGDLGIREK